MFKEKRIIFDHEMPDPAEELDKNDKFEWSTWLKKLFGLETKSEKTVLKAELEAGEKPKEPEDDSKANGYKLEPTGLGYSETKKTEEKTANSPAKDEKENTTDSPKEGSDKAQSDSIFTELDRLEKTDSKLKEARDKYREKYKEEPKGEKPDSNEFKAFKESLKPYLSNTTVANYYKDLEEIEQGRKPQTKENNERKGNLIHRAASAIKNSNDSALIAAWEAYKGVYRTNHKDMPDSEEFKTYKTEIKRVKENNSDLKEYWNKVVSEMGPEV